MTIFLVVREVVVGIHHYPMEFIGAFLEKDRANKYAIADAYTCVIPVVVQ